MVWTSLNARTIILFVNVKLKFKIIDDCRSHNPNTEENIFKLILITDTSFEDVSCVFIYTSINRSVSTADEI
jgi:hypothetical protein